LRTITTSTGRFPSFNPARASAAGERQSTSRALEQPQGGRWKDKTNLAIALTCRGWNARFPSQGRGSLIATLLRHHQTRSHITTARLPALDLGQAREQGHLVASNFASQVTNSHQQDGFASTRQRSKTPAQLLQPWSRRRALSHSSPPAPASLLSRILHYQAHTKYEYTVQRRI
jgi:hypothetical protein